MNKQLQTISPVIPKGYTGKTSDYNSWVRYWTRELDKIKNTNVAQRLSV